MLMAVFCLYVFVMPLGVMIMPTTKRSNDDIQGKEDSESDQYIHTNHIVRDCVGKSVEKGVSEQATGS